MQYKNYCVVSGILFALVALAHLLRIVNGVSIHLDEYVVQMFASWIGFIVPAVLAAWAFRLSRQHGD